MAPWGLGKGSALRRYRKAMDAYRRTLESWQQEAEALRGHIAMAHQFQGVTAADEPSLPLQLHAGERVFDVVERAALVEPRKLPDRWVGGYSGFSFRLARGVRYHVGATKGRRVPGEEVPTAIDTGTASITDRRVVFQGSRRSREWDYAKLLGYQHDPAQPLTLFQVSNREKVSGLMYDRQLAEEVHFRLALALAHGRGEVDQLVRHLEQQQGEHESERPVPPQLPPQARSALGRSRDG